MQTLVSLPPPLLPVAMTGAFPIAPCDNYPIKLYLNTYNIISYINKEKATKSRCRLWGIRANREPIGA